MFGVKPRNSCFLCKRTIINHCVIITLFKPDARIKERREERSYSLDLGLSKDNATVGTRWRTKSSRFKFQSMQVPPPPQNINTVQYVRFTCVESVNYVTRLSTAGLDGDENSSSTIQEKIHLTTFNKMYLIVFVLRRNK